MKEEIKKEIQKEVMKLGESLLAEETERREPVCMEMQELIKRTNILNGGLFTSKDLCDSIKIQKKVHNLQPIGLPKLVGNYQYNVHFKGYAKTEEEFIKEHPERNGFSGHPGVNLEEFSHDLSNIIKAKGNEFFGSFNSFKEHVGMGMATLSGYLYLMYPDKYPLVNGASIGGMEVFIGKQHGSLIRKYAEQEKQRQNITLPINNTLLRKYLAWCNLLREMLEIDGLSNFHVVDALLWRVNKTSNKEHYFAVSFGEEDIVKWNDYLQNGYHAIGWDEMNKSLIGMTEGEIEEFYKEAYPEKSANSRAAQMYSIKRFVELQPGDKIIANLGKKEILGIGEVVSGYYYERSADIFRHRVKVSWTDKKRRNIPIQSGWANTLKVLSAGQFNDLAKYKETSEKPDGVKLFTKEMFEWFEGIHNNPTKTYYNETKFKYNQFVNTPFKALIKRVAEKLPAYILKKIETEKGVRSHILKNDYGIGNAYDYLWFAFYPEGSSRTKDAQLFCCVNKDLIRCGFYIGAYGEFAREKFSENIQNNKAEFMELINSLQGTPNLKLTYQESASQGAVEENEISLPINDKQLDEWLGKDLKNILVKINKDEAIKKGDLSNEIAMLFRQIFPIWLYAVVDDMGDFEPSEPPEEIDEKDIYTKDKLITETFYEEKEMDSILNALDRKKNVVFFGPPGTGKTFVARKIASYLVEGRKDNIDYIQFHQSYAYEDFIEGIRPLSKKGNDGNIVIDYPVVQGIFTRLCKKASINPEQKFIMLIDEFNRGNISKIFGELLYLLEYRNKENSISLPYSKQTFYVPDNVYLIATMNTADRSLTHIDFAMRRRFSFIRFDVETDILSKWGENNGLMLESLISVLDDINEHIGDENYYIGITYFMREDLKTTIQSVWKYEIYPYIKEYFINDDTERAENFTWENVKPKLQDIID